MRFDATQIQGVLKDAAPVVVPIPQKVPPVSVWVSPAAGDTVRVEHRICSSAPWRVWDKGDVTAYAEDVLDGNATELRFTRLAGTGTTSAYGVL